MTEKTTQTIALLALLLKGVMRGRSGDCSARRDCESKFRLAVLCESGLAVADGLILHKCGVIIHKAIVFWPEI